MPLCFCYKFDGVHRDAKSSRDCCDAGLPRGCLQDDNGAFVHALAAGASAGLKLLHFALCQCVYNAAARAAASGGAIDSFRCSTAPPSYSAVVLLEMPVFVCKLRRLSAAMSVFPSCVHLHFQMRINLYIPRAPFTLSSPFGCRYSVRDIFSPQRTGRELLRRRHWISWRQAARLLFDGRWNICRH